MLWYQTRDAEGSGPLKILNFRFALLLNKGLWRYCAPKNSSIAGTKARSLGKAPNLYASLFCHHYYEHKLPTAAVGPLTFFCLGVKLKSGHQSLFWPFFKFFVRQHLLFTPLFFGFLTLFKPTFPVITVSIMLFPPPPILTKISQRKWRGMILTAVGDLFQN